MGLATALTPKGGVGGVKSTRTLAAGVGKLSTPAALTDVNRYQYVRPSSMPRSAYVRARFTFDLIWPLVYTFFLATAISWLFRGASAALLHRLNLVPIFGAVFDYLENISTSLVMLRYPQPTPFVDQLAPFLTLVKWILVYGSFAVLLAGVGVAAVGWMRRRSRPA